MRCKLNRFLISNAMDSDREAPAFAQRHAEDCPDCQQYHAMSHALTQRLIKDAKSAGCVGALPVKLEHVPIYCRPFALLPIMVCLIVASLFLLRNSLKSNMTGDSEWLVAEWDELASRATDIVPGNPLAREIILVAEDSKNAAYALISCAGLDPDTLFALSD